MKIISSAKIYLDPLEFLSKCATAVIHNWRNQCLTQDGLDFWKHRSDLDICGKRDTFMMGFKGTKIIVIVKENPENLLQAALVSNPRFTFYVSMPTKWLSVSQNLINIKNMNMFMNSKRWKKAKKYISKLKYEWC